MSTEIATAQPESRQSKDEFVQLSQSAINVIGNELLKLLADVFTLYVKTKNFHWHIGGPHFREYHLLLDEQADQLFAMTDQIAERGRKLGVPSIHSIAELVSVRRLTDSETTSMRPIEMLSALRADNRRLIGFMYATHRLSDEGGDVATASLIENWIDEAERRIWFLAATIEQA